jgi:hypothetical protein
MKNTPPYGPPWIPAAAVEHMVNSETLTTRTTIVTEIPNRLMKV